MIHYTPPFIVHGQLPRFLDIIEKQFTGCGQKYAFSDRAEWTDVIAARHRDWVEGTIEKYVGRYKQYRAGRDLIKIATYAMILSLKHGLVQGLDSLVDGEDFYCTTVPMKAKHWPVFRGMVEQVAFELIDRRETYCLPEPMSGFDVTRQFDDLSNLTQILIKMQQFPHVPCPRKNLIPAVIAFLCFIQWVQDGHHLAAKVDDDDPRETHGRKFDVEDMEKIAEVGQFEPPGWPKSVSGVAERELIAP